MFLLNIVGVQTFPLRTLKDESLHVSAVGTEWRKSIQLVRTHTYTYEHTHLKKASVCVDVEEQRLTSGYWLIKTVPEK